MQNPDSICIDEKCKSVRITLSPTLYPQTAVMRAAYRFTEDFDVIVDGSTLAKIFVTLNVKDEDKKTVGKKDLEQLSSAFFSELIHANVEETQSRRYADTRNALIGAALRNLMINATPEAMENLGKKPVVREEPTAFEKIYKYMPKQNCGKCGANCETTAKNILSRKSGIDVCAYLKKPEFSVVRCELENTLRTIKCKNDSCENDDIKENA